MQTIVVGAGAMGSLLAAMLKKNGQKVLLYDIDSNKISKIKQNGITVINKDKSKYHVQIQAEDCLVKNGKRLFVVFVKSYQTRSAAKAIAQIANKDDVILTLQNGLGNIEQLEEFFSRKQICAGVTYLGATEKSVGIILHTGVGLTSIASLAQSQSSFVVELVSVWNKCGIKTTVTDNVVVMSWTKLLVNSVINPLAAIYGIRNGELIKNSQIEKEMAEVLVEGVSVAQKIDISLDYENMWQKVQDTCRLTAGNIASMLADVQAGRRTEIDSINGYIVEKAEQYGVDTPINKKILSYINKFYERGPVLG